MDPIAKITLVHNNYYSRVTWDPRVNEGWYIWTTMLHYIFLT